MTHWRELISTILAVAVMAVTQGDLPLGLITWFAVWLTLMPADDGNPSAERRYRMRETEKRNKAIENDWRRQV